MVKLLLIASVYMTLPSALLASANLAPMKPYDASAIIKDRGYVSTPMLKLVDEELCDEFYDGMVASLFDDTSNHVVTSFNN